MTESAPVRVHVLRYGYALCGLPNEPRSWPVGHASISVEALEEHGTSGILCPACRAAWGVTTEALKAVAELLFEWARAIGRPIETDDLMALTEHVLTARNRTRLRAAVRWPEDAGP